MITFLNILTIVLDCIVIGISLAVIFRYFRKDKWFYGQNIIRGQGALQQKSL